MSRRQLKQELEATRRELEDCRGELEAALRSRRSLEATIAAMWRDDAKRLYVETPGDYHIYVDLFDGEAADGNVLVRHGIALTVAEPDSEHPARVPLKLGVRISTKPNAAP